MVLIHSQFHIKRYEPFSVHLPKLGDYCLKVAIDPATYVYAQGHML